MSERFESVDVSRFDERFPGLSYGEMLEAEVGPSRELIDGLAEAGTVGTIASVPELGKSFLAVEIAHKVAAGGQVLGRFDVVRSGPVAYWWQDDSRANELARLKSYAGVHGYTTAHPSMRFHLNEGLRLPDDLPALRAEVEQEEQVLVVLDSLYNFLSGVVLKDEDVAAIFGALKSEVCDPTGAAVLVVDHAPWPTEATRSQRGRAYGSVFKGAAIRWGIYLEPEGKTKTYISARGNNVRGLKRTPCYFDPDALELRLVDSEQLGEEELDELVLNYVREHPDQPTSKVAEGVGKRRAAVVESLERLGTLQTVKSKPSRELGRPGTGIYWFPSDHAASEPSGLLGTAQDALPLASLSEAEASQPSHPRRGDASRTDASNSGGEST